IQIRNEIDKNMTEILGLKLMYDMDPNCQRLEESQLQKLMAMKKNTDADDTRDTPVEEVVGHLEGETLAKMIDFLDKEMVRLIDERKIHALILLAERERKLKEAAEGGKRFQEEETRRANDEIFKQVTGIHQSTVDLYLEDIFLESCDRAADDQSRIYVQRLATTLNDALYSARQAMTEFEQEELAADLVSSFMIPELHRLYHNSRVDAAGARFTKASEQVVDAVFSAHPIAKQIMDELEPVVDEHIVRGVAAVDGGTKIMDEIIAEAVCVALLGTQPEQSSGSQDTSSTTKSQTESTPTTDTTKTDSSSTKHTTTSDKKSDDLPQTASLVFRPTYGQAQLSFHITSIPVLDEQTDEKQDVDGPEQEEEDEDVVVLEADGEEEEDDEADEDEEIAPPELPKMTFCVDDLVVRSLAAKSIQVTYDTEPGQKSEAVYTGASQTVDQLFEEVKRTVITPRLDDSASDATLSDDTDD
ncbi:Protein MAATS1, partial [Orchesella cincta]